MPHIAVTMLPGRDRETKQKLAENLCNTLIETLGGVGAQPRVTPSVVRAGSG